MKTKIITMSDSPHSAFAAARCAKSLLKLGIEPEFFEAWTPAHNPREHVMKGWDLSGFEKSRKWSRLEPVIACFSSHYSLWKECSEGDESFLICEHDSIFHARPPEIEAGKVCCNVGQPSFGRYRMPEKGFGGLQHATRFKGLHAYIVTPEGARELCAKAPTECEAADNYVRLSRFPWLQEFFPWPAKCEDTVSHIQKEAGCRAKKNRVVPV